MKVDFHGKKKSERNSDIIPLSHNNFSCLRVWMLIRCHCKILQYQLTVIHKPSFTQKYSYRTRNSAGLCRIYRHYSPGGTYHYVGKKSTAHRIPLSSNYVSTERWGCIYPVIHIAVVRTALHNFQKPGIFFHTGYFSICYVSQI
jgi:hypothetical protein